MSSYIGNKPAGAKDYVTDTPIGSIMAWGSLTLPLGWIECNGQSTSGYPELATIVGANVPDLRGEFIRGVDNGRSVDAGRVLGSAQADEFKSHSHKIQSRNVYNTTAGGKAFSGGGGATPDSSEVSGGAETRPRNVALVYIIRAYDVIKEGDGIISYIGKNYLMNPDFNINQRGYAGTAIAAASRLYDRWKVSWAGGGTKSFPVDSSGFITLGSGVSMFQGVEFNSALAGKTMTISWEGTAGVWIERADGYTYVTHSSPHTFVAPSTEGSFGELDYIGFASGTVKNVKLELGGTPTPYETPEEVTELAKCQRFYWRSTSASDSYCLHGMGVCISTTQARICIEYPVMMRAIPSFTSSGALRVYKGGAYPITALAAIYGQNLKTFNLVATVASGLTQGHAIEFTNNADGAAYIEFSADI